MADNINEYAGENVAWIAREEELLNKIHDLESKHRQSSVEYTSKIRSLQENLEVALKGQERLIGLEKELTTLQNRKDSDEVKNLKAKHDNILTKAKDLLFEKTKTSKQQEIQIDALRNQVLQLKEVVQITKDMLEIRNTEAKHLNNRFDTIELRLQAEKEKHLLIEKKFEISKKMYTDLKSEYDIQSALFKVGSLS